MPFTIPRDQAQRHRTEVRENDPMPVWFAPEGEKLYLLPVRGSDTQWYQNVLQDPSIRIDARGAEAELRAQPVTESEMVKSVIEKFREKYGAKALFGIRCGGCGETDPSWNASER